MNRKAGKKRRETDRKVRWIEGSNVSNTGRKNSKREQ
jgi:hypothetical protein